MPPRQKLKGYTAISLDLTLWRGIKVSHVFWSCFVVEPRSSVTFSGLALW